MATTNQNESGARAMDLDTIETVLEGYKPGLREEFTAAAQASFETLVRQFGPSLRGASSSWDKSVRGALELVRGLTRHTGDRPSDPVELVAERVTRAAAAYANDVVADCAAKLRAKLAELENAECTAFHGFGYFRIRGTRQGRAVECNQQRIVNVSVRGKLFNQYPARLKLDGKAISAKAYAAAFPVAQ